MSNYIEARIFTTTAGLDPAIGVLMDNGIESFVIEDAAEFQDFLDSKRVYDWDYVSDDVMRLKEVETNITFYLDVNDESKDILHSISRSIASLKDSDKEYSLGRLFLEIKDVDDGEWKDNWKAYFKPVRMTNSIVVKPTWEDYEQKEGEIVIEFDPGMAFGTGNHATTSMCVELLEKYIEKDKDIVLDVGTGSGILTMAAAFLGAKHAYGVDIDPVAIDVASENVKYNHLSDKVSISVGNLTDGLAVKADIVLANLSLDLILALSSDISKHMQGKSIFIVSGILKEKKSYVLEHLTKRGFEKIDDLTKDDWYCVCLKRTN